MITKEPLDLPDESFKGKGPPASRRSKKLEEEREVHRHMMVRFESGLGMK
jgi:hypothetical protein